MQFPYVFKLLGRQTPDGAWKAPQASKISKNHASELDVLPKVNLPILIFTKIPCSELNCGAKPSPCQTQS
jgi:hypothetical protein